MKKVIYLLTLSVILLVGCNTEELQSPNSDLNLKTADLKNAPDQSGSYVIRFEGLAGFLIADGEKGISALIGVNAEDYCNFGTIEGRQMVQLVDVPADEARLIYLGIGEASTEVLDGIFAGGDLSAFCDFLVNTPRLAVGTSHFVRTDNDLDISEAANVNTWGATFTGELLNTDEETVGFLLLQRWVLKKNDGFKYASSQIKLN